MRRLFLSVLIFLCPVLAVTGTGTELPRESPQRAVLVTGASSGIGRNITERLASEGFYVYAGARQERHLRALGAIDNVQPVRIDVTDTREIEAAVETISRGGRGLYALVNNAGVATLAPVIDSNEEEFNLVMAVNVAGPYRITKAFAPLIIADKGRIINIGSISGILAGRNVSAYSMSKHAIEAFTDSLASEMEDFGVEVSVIEPGNYKSDIARNAVKRAGPDVDPRIARLADRSGYEEPDDVSAAVLLALLEPDPKGRYLVVPEEAEAERTIRKQIRRLVQLNEGHVYTYDRTALIRMLDEALEGSRPRTTR